MSPKIHFHFLTLFPETIQVWLTTSILGRAREAGLFDFQLYQLREFSHDKHRTVDDSAYGGGGGMVLKVEPLAEAVEKIRLEVGRDQSTVIYFSPVGQRLDQTVLSELATRSPSPHHYILVCGHYEGVDQRFVDHWVDLEISLGDFVLTGGELPALALADALIRQLEGALGQPGAHRTESFSLADRSSGAPLLEYPHYTRPAEFRGLKVPDVLLSGDHKKIEAWRETQSIERTRRVRPELLPPRESC